MNNPVNVVPIEIDVNRQISVTRSVLYEYDTGAVVEFTPAVPDGSHCEFDSMLKSYETTVSNSQAAIPDELLNDDCHGDIVGHLVTVAPETDRFTTYDFKIHVVRRLFYEGVTPAET